MRIPLLLAVVLTFAACGQSPKTEAAAPAGNADPNAAERYAGSLQRDVQKAGSVADRANAAVKKAELSQKELEAETK